MPKIGGGAQWHTIECSRSGTLGFVAVTVRLSWDHWTGVRSHCLLRLQTVPEESPATRRAAGFAVDGVRLPHEVQPLRRSLQIRSRLGTLGFVAFNSYVLLWRHRPPVDRLEIGRGYAPKRNQTPNTVIQ